MLNFKFEYCEYHPNNAIFTSKDGAMKPRILILILLLLNSCLLSAQNNYTALEEKVNALKKQEKFESAIKEIVTFENNHEGSHYDLYKSALLKSYVYKALFNYEETFKYLDIALKEGLQSDKAEEVADNVKAEKAFALFDILKYDEAYQLMSGLKKSGYKNIGLTSVGYLLMQEGYIYMLKKNYVKAEIALNEAITTLQKANPVDLPIVYGKMILLHSETGNNEKCQNAYQKGIACASKYKMTKYMLYMEESMRTFYERSGQCEQANASFHRIDSLENMYNAVRINNKVRLLEKDLQLQQKEHQLKKESLITKFLLALLTLLLIGIYFGFRFNRERQKKSAFLEKENNRIHDELELLIGKFDTLGLQEMNLSQYGFSDRQIEIIMLLKDGKSNKEIGNQLFISENTVKYHLKSIYTTLGVENRTVFMKMLMR